MQETTQVPEQPTEERSPMHVFTTMVEARQGDAADTPEKVASFVDNLRVFTTFKGQDGTPLVEIPSIRTDLETMGKYEPVWRGVFKEVLTADHEQNAQKVREMIRVVDALGMRDHNAHAKAFYDNLEEKYKKGDDIPKNDATDKLTESTSEKAENRRDAKATVSDLLNADYYAIHEKDSTLPPTAIDTLRATYASLTPEQVKQALKENPLLPLTTNHEIEQLFPPQYQEEVASLISAAQQNLTKDRAAALVRDNPMLLLSLGNIDLAHSPLPQDIVLFLREQAQTTLTPELLSMTLAKDPGQILAFNYHVSLGDAGTFGLGSPLTDGAKDVIRQKAQTLTPEQAHTYLTAHPEVALTLNPYRTTTPLPQSSSYFPFTQEVKDQMKKDMQALRFSLDTSSPSVPQQVAVHAA